MRPQDGVHPVAREEAERLIAVWEAAVRSTHHFLGEPDIAFFRPLVREGVFAFEHLECVRDASGALVAFVGVDGPKMEALFVHPAWQGRGIGLRLARHAIDARGAVLVDVNEQNEAALAFYRRIGFEVIGRSERDGAGRAFPLLHMRLALDPR